MDAIPERVEHAVIAIPTQFAPDSLRSGAKVGLRTATVMSADFTETQTERGRRLQADLKAAAEETGVRVCGPNCLGHISTAEGAYLYAIDFGEEPFLVDDFAWISQSGALTNNLAHTLRRRGLGVRYLISCGNQADLEIADYVEFCVKEGRTRAIGLFVEGVVTPEPFLAACATAREAEIPIVVVKAGRSQQAREAALTHTGVLAGSDRVFEEICDEMGLIRVGDLDQLLETAHLLLRLQHPIGGRIAVMVHSGGARGLILDQVEQSTVEFPRLGDHAMTGLRQILPPGTFIGNPLDTVGSVYTCIKEYLQCSELLLSDPSIDTLCVQAELPVGPIPREEGFRGLPSLAERHGKPVIAFSALATTPNEYGRRFLQECRLPFLEGLSRAWEAIKAVNAHQHSDRRDPTPALKLTESQLAAGKRILDSLPTGTLHEAQTNVLLDAFGLPVASWRLARDEDEAERMSAELTFPLALKVASFQITHKARVGGVRLGLRDPAEVRSACAEMREEIRRRVPEARIEGFLLQQMVSGIAEVLIGYQRDPQFGPMIIVGTGGPMVETLDDVVLHRAPISAAKAQALLARTVVGQHLRSLSVEFRLLVDLIEKFSLMAIAVKDRLSSLDVNPVIVSPDGQATVVDTLAVATNVTFVK